MREKEREIVREREKEREKELRGREVWCGVVCCGAWRSGVAAATNMKKKKTGWGYVAGD